MLLCERGGHAAGVEAQAQGLRYVLVPRELSREEWEKEYCVESAGAGEREKK